MTVLFLQTAKDEKLEQTIWANLEGIGYGGYPLVRVGDVAQSVSETHKMDKDRLTPMPGTGTTNKSPVRRHIC